MAFSRPSSEAHVRVCAIRFGLRFHCLSRAMKVLANIEFARSSVDAVAPGFEHPQNAATVARTQRLVRRRRTKHGPDTATQIGS